MRQLHQLRHMVWLIIVVLLLAGITQPNESAKAAVGFRISGRNLLDVNGNNFIMRGINHPHVWYTSQTNSFANIKAAGANTVRVVLGGGRWGPSSASDVSNVINLCKTNKLVCVLENHDTTGYGEDGAATSLATAVNYWKSIQSVLTGQEAYVIINIGNEPYGNNNYANWVNDTKNAIIALRTAGFQHVLMVDAPNWGQDWSFTMRDNAPSVKAADTTGNTIFSIHMYGVFDTAAEVQAYVSSFVSRGLPLVIGEFGDNHSDGNPDENAIMSTAQSNGIGYIGWSWSGNGGGVEYLDMVTGFNPSQRTAWGTRFITGANGLSTTSVQCTCYSGTTPANTRTNTPTGPTATRTPTRTPTRTNTPGGPTATRTNTPISLPTNTPGGTSGGLKVQIMKNGGDDNKESQFKFKVINTSTSVKSNITVRVYFTLDGSQTASKYVLEKYFSTAGNNVSGPTLASGSTYYFTIDFGTASLAAGGSWESHHNLHLNDWSMNLSTANDWWHGGYVAGALPASFADTTRLPAYVNGTLSWGTQP